MREAPASMVIVWPWAKRCCSRKLLSLLFEITSQTQYWIFVVLALAGRQGKYRFYFSLHSIIVLNVALRFNIRQIIRYFGILLISWSYGWYENINVYMLGHSLTTRWDLNVNIQVGYYTDQSISGLYLNKSNLKYILIAGQYRRRVWYLLCGQTVFRN